jgi:dihydrofolate synthase/folylpolyglutamate synthase
MDRILLEKLYSLRRFGIKPGLERISALLKKVGNPHEKLRAIHIAGTNGKGSVSSLLASILQESGYRTGLYTSPHIYSFNERIKINGKPIPDPDLEHLVAKYLDIGKDIEATFFEITTAVAFEYFANQGTDICVLETGLGGLHDATNVITPLVSVITKIDFDHEEYIGRTIEEITTQKAGIIKPNRPTVIAKNPKLVYDTILKLNRFRTDIFFVNKLTSSQIIDISPRIMKATISTFENGEYYIESPLIGKHQIDNISTAIVTSETLKSFTKITKETIIEGIKKVRTNTGLFGRFEAIRDNPPIIIDGAHNPDAVDSTVELLGEIYPNTKWIIIFNAMKDKNYKKMLSFLVPIADTFFFPNLQYERANSNVELVNTLKELKTTNEGSKFFPTSIKFDTTLEALNYADSLEKPILIIGSFYLLGELIPILKEKYLYNFPLQNDNYILI